MSRKTVVLLDNDEGRKLANESCKASGFKFAEFKKLVRAQVKYAGSTNRYRLYADFDDILDRIKIEGD